jgi:hypothetical protein
VARFTRNACPWVHQDRSYLGRPTIRPEASGHGLRAVLVDFETVDLALEQVADLSPRVLRSTLTNLFSKAGGFGNTPCSFP